MPRLVSRPLLAAITIAVAVAACAKGISKDPCEQACQRTADSALASCGKAGEQILDADKVRFDKCELGAMERKVQCDKGCAK